MTCLRWILGYMRLEIWRKIGLFRDWVCMALHTRSGACYCCIVSVVFRQPSPQHSGWNITLEMSAVAGHFKQQNLGTSWRVVWGSDAWKYYRRCGSNALSQLWFVYAVIICLRILCWFLVSESLWKQSNTPIVLQFNEKMWIYIANFCQKPSVFCIALALWLKSDDISSRPKT